MLEVSPLHAYPPSFIYPSITLDSRPLFQSHSFHPERFPFFHPFSICFPFLPLLLFLPPSLSVFWTFLLVLSVCLHPASPPPSYLCDEWVCLLGAVHIYWAGERTLSVSLALHISIPPLKRQREQEVTVGWKEEGGPGQETSSPPDSSWLGGEHVSFSILTLDVVEGEKSSLPLDQAVNAVIQGRNKQSLSIPLCATRQPTLSTQCNAI